MSDGQVIDFEAHAIGRLRARVAALDEANADLLAQARGQKGAAAQIHAAALAAMDAEGRDHLIHVVTQDWVDMLDVDAVALSLDPAEATDGPDVRVNAVPGGAALFGPAAELIRCEILIQLRQPGTKRPIGLLALGTRRACGGLDGGHGTELLAFLGAVVARMINRWPPSRS